MEKKEEEGKQPEQEPQEKKPPPISGSLIWYLLIGALAVAFVLHLMRSDADVKILYSDLVRLINERSPEEVGTIEITDLRKGKPYRARFSNLSDLEVGRHEIRGTVTMEVLAPEPESPKHKVKFRTARLGLEEDKRFLDLLWAKGLRYTGEDPPSSWGYFMPFLLPALLVFVFLFFIMRRLGGAGGAIAFGRSRGKLIAQEDVGVTFSDVAGIDEAVDELREVVDFLKTPEKFRVLGGRIPKGVLLVGPPGTGKTLLARAIAGEAGVPYFSLSGSDFVEMFVGVGAARVRDMFQQAQVAAPCIVFIDELDALGKTRGSSVVGGHDEREQTLNALLVEMDGFSSNSGVIVLAATNRPETLDPALLRPGRFDRHVLVDRPDIRGRQAILEVHVEDVKLDESVNLKAVAAITSGFVGADLANLVNEAALLAARKDKEAVTMEELNEAVERVTAGLEKRQRIINEAEKQRVAYHESAHALVACSLPDTDPVHKVSIIPRGLAALGYTLTRPEGDHYLVTQSELESRIQVLLAGTVAEELVFDDVSTGAQNDLERATEIARSMVMDFGMSRLGRVNYRERRTEAFLPGAPELPAERSHSEQTAREIDQEIKRIVDESLEKVRHVLETRRKALEALAARLIDKEVIDTVELDDIIEANSPSAAIVPGTDAPPKPKRPASEKHDSSQDRPSDSEPGEARG
ncbi:MAG: ATP-dependent zinc metalloprotease FtsH [Planctomycetota bacterium]|jgi:cell division protease FtsH